MARLVVCAAKAYAGVKHRYVMLRQVKAFAQRYGYGVRFLWGVTRGVSDCRHEELFAPIPGVEVRNISAGELAALSYFCQRDGGFTYHGEPFLMLRDGRIPGERFFSWDLAGSEALARKVRGPHPPLACETVPFSAVADRCLCPRQRNPGEAGHSRAGDGVLYSKR